MPRPDRLPPADVDAEVALIACCLLSPQAVTTALETVLPEDFYKPVHQLVWESIRVLHRRGDPVDTVTVSGLMKESEHYDDLSWLTEAQVSVPSISRAPVYAASVVRASRLRAALSAAAEITDVAYQPGADPDEALATIAALADDRRLLPRNVGLPDELTTVTGFLEWYANQYPDEEAEWIVPGMLRRRHRMMFVGTEGGGKSTLLRQICMCIANGVHPFSLSFTIPQQRVLMIDCENPDDVIESQIRLVDKITGLPMSESEDLFIWRQEAGLDLRAKRTDQARFEKAIAEVRPAVVAIGPVYKIYSNAGSSGVELEQSALELFRFLDPLRKRYGFALLMEHHAPRGASGVRDLVPFGTVAWQRWPEFGIKLLPEELDEHEHPHKLVVKRFRGDRKADVVLPTHLLREPGNSSGLPWTAIMPTGHWHAARDKPQDHRNYDPGSEPF